MRADSICGLMLVATAACSSGNADDRVPVSFEFRNMVPGETTIAQATKSHTVRICPDTPERVECLAHRHGYGDIRMGFLTFVFENSVFVGFHADVASSDFDTHYGATRWNYGYPCRRENEQIGSRRFVWCFTQGELVLEETVDSGGRAGRVTFGATHPGVRALRR